MKDLGFGGSADFGREEDADEGAESFCSVLSGFAHTPLPLLTLIHLVTFAPPCGMVTLLAISASLCLYVCLKKR